MKVLERKAYAFGNAQSGPTLDVEVYRLEFHVLVVLRGSKSSDPGLPMEQLARQVRQELLAPEGLEGMELFWIHWSSADRVARQIVFQDPQELKSPFWGYLVEDEFSRILEGFSAEDLLETWIREGALDLETWEEIELPLNRKTKKPN